MKVHSLLFQPEMVQATLAGSKSQTRRMRGLEEINRAPDNWVFVGMSYRHDEGCVMAEFAEPPSRLRRRYIKVPWQVGDWIYVKENFQVQEVQRYYDTEWQNNICIDFPASQGTRQCRHWFEMPGAERPRIIRRRHPEKIFTSSSIHMPQRIARIWLEVTEVRCQRLWDICERDVTAEGAGKEVRQMWLFGLDAKGKDEVYRRFFERLWKSIHGEESWERNDWVFPITFKVLSTTGKPKYKSLESIPDETV